MRAPILRMGSNGPEVRAMQTKLNEHLPVGGKLNPDGRFGALTRAAVIKFQQKCWLVADGEAGPCTLNALFGREAFAPVLHAVPFIAQPTQSTCWAASTAMLTRSSVGSVIQRTPADLLWPDGSLRNYSDTNDAVTESKRFAKCHGMHVLAPMSWTPRGLQGLLGRGPLIFDLLWDVDGYVSGLGSPGHMIAVVGIRGDDETDGLGTTLRIHDPWPPNRGRRYSMGYAKWVARVPTLTYRIFHRA